MATRTYRSQFLKTNTVVEVTSRDDLENLLACKINGDSYLVRRLGCGRYQVMKTGGNTYTVQMDDFDSSCTCKGFISKVRFQCCRHLVAVAVLAKDVAVQQGFACQKVEAVAAC